MFDACIGKSITDLNVNQMKVNYCILYGLSNVLNRASLCVWLSMCVYVYVYVCVLASVYAYLYVCVCVCE